MRHTRCHCRFKKERENDPKRGVFCFIFPEYFDLPPRLFSRLGRSLYFFFLSQRCAHYFCFPDLFAFFPIFPDSLQPWKKYTQASAASHHLVWVRRKTEKNVSGKKVRYQKQDIPERLPPKYLKIEKFPHEQLIPYCFPRILLYFGIFDSKKQITNVARMLKVNADCSFCFRIHTYIVILLYWVETRKAILTVCLNEGLNKMYV